MKREKMVRMLTNLGLMIVTFFIMGIFAEGMARLLFKESTNLMPRYHTSAQYEDVVLRRTRPNMTFWHTTVDGQWKFETNLQGFRNVEDFEYEKPSGGVRVVSLGDSHTQGHECLQEYTYSATIQKYLDSRGIAAEVMNTGVSGFSTAEALLLLDREMLKYDPDYVVLGFFANDFEDNLKAGMFEISEGELRLVKQEHIPGVRIQDFIYALPGIQWLGENSYFYSVLFNTTWEFYKSRLAASARDEMPTEYAVATRDGYSEYELELAAALIAELGETARSAGAKFILMDIPTWEGTDRYGSSIPDALLRKIGGAYDLLIHADVLARYQGAARFHVPNGGRHITEFTHTILGTRAAEFIVDEISKNSDQGSNSGTEDLKDSQNTE